MHDQLIASGRPEATLAPLLDASVALLRARVAHAGPATIAPLQAAVIDDLTPTASRASRPPVRWRRATATSHTEVIELHIASDLRALRIRCWSCLVHLIPRVTARGNATAAREALAGNPTGKVVVFDGLSH